MAWMKTLDSNRRDDRGRPAKIYRVECVRDRTR